MITEWEKAVIRPQIKRQITGEGKKRLILLKWNHTGHSNIGENILLPSLSLGVNVILSAVSALEAVDPEVYPGCIAVRQDNYDKGAVEHLKLIHREWCNEVRRLLGSIDDLVDVQRFVELSGKHPVVVNHLGG